MPARIGSVREKNNSTSSDKSLSESEGSFVSARSENTSGKSTRSSLIHHNNQSALSPLTSRHAAFNTSESDSSTSSTQEQATPLARQPILFSSTSGLPPTRLPRTADSYFAPQEGASSIELWSPANRRAPASRSSYGKETRSGPRPALSTQRSYNADLPWQSPPPGETAGLQTFQEDRNGDINSALISEKDLYSLGAGKIGKRADSTTYGLGPMARRRTESGSRNDEERTLGIEAQIRQDGQGNKGQHRQREDLFLNLARADSVVDGSDTMSRFERRRVSNQSISLLSYPFTTR